MASISGATLKQKIKNTIDAQLTKKCEYLELGKSVTKIKQNLMALYNYYYLAEYCALTSDEINCIVNDIATTCTFAPAKKLEPELGDGIVVAPPPVEFLRLAATIECVDFVASSVLKDYTVVGDGQNRWKAFAFQGSGGYTYQWSVFNSSQANAGSVGDLTLSNTTTDTVTVDGMRFRRTYGLRCVVKDSQLNQTTLETTIIEGSCGYFYNRS